MSDTQRRIVIAASAVLLAAFTFYTLFLNHVEINEVGVAYNSIGGKVWIQSRPGWYLTSLTVKVANISTLPQQVQVYSQAKVLNYKIVRFNPDGIDEFIRLQGFEYYEVGGSMNNILTGYAFSGRRYPFLDVLQESGDENFKPKPLGQP